MMKLNISGHYSAAHGARTALWLSSPCQTTYFTGRHILQPTSKLSSKSAVKTIDWTSQVSTVNILLLVQSVPETRSLPECYTG